MLARLKENSVGLTLAHTARLEYCAPSVGVVYSPIWLFTRCSTGSSVPYTWRYF